MAKILDPTQAPTIADEVVSTLEYDGGWSDVEMIPGLVLAIMQIAARSPDDEEQILDEAMDMLADPDMSRFTPPDLDD